MSPWGRRRPLMVAGVSIQLAFFGLLVFAHSYLAILVLMLLIETAAWVAASGLVRAKMTRRTVGPGEIRAE